MQIEPKIIYEDKDVLVLNKPAGLLVHPTEKQEKNTLVDWLLARYPEIRNVGEGISDCRDRSRPVSTQKGVRPGTVHRLDKDTSGLLVVAKNQRAYDCLKKQFKERKVIKKYLALVYGAVKPGKGTIVRSIGRTKSDFRKKRISDFLSGKRAKTKYRVLRYYSLYNCHSEQRPRACREAEAKNLVIPRRLTAPQHDKIQNIFSLLEVCPETGRTHQIRVHLASIGHPIVGDQLYKFKRQKPLPGLKRQFLHAYYLRLQLPSGEIKAFEIDLASDLRQFLSQK